MKKTPLRGMIERLLKHAHARYKLALNSKVDLLQKVESMNPLDIMKAGGYYPFALIKDGASHYNIVRELENHFNLSTQDHVMTIVETFLEEGHQEGTTVLLVSQGQYPFGSKAVEKKPAL